jgi:ABC-type glycerol-3-phosphate transport system substrate-binding protein
LEGEIQLDDTNAILQLDVTSGKAADAILQLDVTSGKAADAILQLHVTSGKAPDAIQLDVTSGKAPDAILQLDVTSGKAPNAILHSPFSLDSPSHLHLQDRRAERPSSTSSHREAFFQKQPDDP